MLIIDKDGQIANTRDFNFQEICIFGKTDYRPEAQLGVPNENGIYEQWLTISNADTGAKLFDRFMALIEANNRGDATFYI